MFVFAHSGIQHILCCVFAFVFLRLVDPMLSVPLDCPFLIALSVLIDVQLVKMNRDPIAMRRIAFAVYMWYGCKMNIVTTEVVLL